MEELENRRNRIAYGCGQEKIDKRHANGDWTARERLGSLFDSGSFTEIGMHTRHHCSNFGMQNKEIPGDGIVSGFGLVDGRPVAAVSADFLAQGGSLGYMHAQKICDAQRYALKAGMPVIQMNDSGGARLQEGVEALTGFADVFYNNVAASGVVPQISLILGPCAGGAAYSPALTDFIIIRRGGAAGMYITGPKVIEQVTYEKCTMDEIGAADVHATVSGNAHFVADSDEEAISIAKKLLTYLPSNNAENPPHNLSFPLDVSDDEQMNAIIPENNSLPLDMKQVIDRLVDLDSFMEVHAGFAQNVIVGFARICGVVVGIIANQPAVKAGCLDIDASDKAARFIRCCDSFNIPLVNLVDVPGFLPGKQQERGGIIRHGAKMIFAYSSATVPKVTLVLRKAYGGAYIAMCCKGLGADAVYAWPCAEIAVMGAQGAVPILYGRELKAIEDPAAREARRQELQAEYMDTFYNPYAAAASDQVTEIINPKESRAKIALTLRTLLSKRETRPAKKHGNMPL
ncbi:MAG: acyl-CoA carboxylase subunit beta [Akkermansia sp.]|nr:acyl-CoA carboxylase subunit beta [Akkermansia sp.]